MRTWFILGVLSSGFILFQTPSTGSDSDQARVQGEWKVTSVLDDGAIVPESVVESHLIREGRLTIKGATLSYINPENMQLHESAFVLTTDVQPKAIDLAGHGRTRSKGIYMLDGDSLVVCLAAPEAKDRPTEFGSPKGSNNLLIWMKRVKVPTATPVKRTTPIEVPKQPPASKPPTQQELDARMRRELIGTWGHQNSDEIVLITFNPDGSFSSSKTPKSGFKKIFREPVRTSGTWKLEEGIIIIRVTASTERDLNGQILSYRVRSISDTQITMIDSTGRMHVQWKTP